MAFTRCPLLPKNFQNLVSNEIGFIGYDILDNIIGPITKSRGILANLYLADIDVYTISDEKENEKILDKICKKYKLNKDDFVMLTEHDPIALIALYIIENSPIYKGKENAKKKKNQNHI